MRMSRCIRDPTAAWLTRPTWVGPAPTKHARSAVDSQGNVWVTGDAESPDFPASRGALDSRFPGEIDLGPLSYGDAFVAKLDATGSSLLYSTYLGGSAPDLGFAIAVDNNDAAYVAGATQSPDFPVTPGGAPADLRRRQRSVARFRGRCIRREIYASGALSYATFLGGLQSESASVIAVDTGGDAYVNAFPNTSTRIENTLSVLSTDGSRFLSHVDR